MLSKSNQLELHYFFSDKSHGFDAFVRNECEKELLNLYQEVAKSLEFKLLVQSEPPKEGGFIDVWKFIGENSNQVTLIVSFIALILSRYPVRNKELEKLQIENLKLDNELKKQELRALNLKSKSENEIDEELVKKVVELLMTNYKIVWRRSNFYRRTAQYKRVFKISNRQLFEGKIVGDEIEIPQKDFHNFILLSDELPQDKIQEAHIDLISPVLKPGKFTWKGFYKNDIINFQMNDVNFTKMVQEGQIPLNNKVKLTTILLQDRKIDEDGEVKVTKCYVRLVIKYSVNGKEFVTPDGQDYLRSK